jgi:NAD(P)-dependent dehydrogenase (short-subunit alcohol dehydrogenase family)
LSLISLIKIIEAKATDSKNNCLKGVKMVQRLKDKVAVITGGSTGIGKGIAKIFVSEGAKVVVCARNDKLLQSVADELSESDCLAIKCDVTKPEDVKNLINKTVEKFSKINIVVNNAGKNPARAFTIEDTTEEEWDEYQGINAKGSFLVSKYAIPEIRKAGGGSIIMITSISANIGQANMGCYNSSKSAQQGLVKSMAVDLAKDKIRVNAISPGWVTVENLKEARKNIIDYINSIHPVGRIGYPEDIAWAAVYLASDESTWVTGSIFDIDGGYTAV